MKKRGANLINYFLTRGVSAAWFNYSKQESMIYSCGMCNYIPNNHILVSHIPEYRAFSSSDCSKKFDFKSIYGNIELESNMLKLQEDVIWKLPPDPVRGYYVTEDSSHAGWKLRINDFPEYPFVYTLIVDSEEIIDFNVIPDKWDINRERD